jgi:regulator of sirC expression with transglutaminase-like and TPR domain
MRLPRSSANSGSAGDRVRSTPTNRIGLILILLLVVTALFSGSALAEPASDASAFLAAKLAVDRRIDPSIDETWVRSEIDRLSRATAAMAGPGANDLQRLRAVRRVVYEAGEWNDHRPFSYDQADPLGRNIKNKLLATYLRTRRGNCVSMPLLFLILANRMGVPVSLVRAPLHLFVRYEVPGGDHVNLETTSGGYPARDAYYRESFDIAERAIQSGVFMRSLSPAEAREEMQGTLLEWYVEQRRSTDAVSLADEMLSIEPNNAVALVWRGMAYDRLVEAEFSSRYASPAAIPPSLRSRYLDLSNRSRADIDAAHALGWRDESERRTPPG